MSDAPADTSCDRIIALALDEASIVRWGPEVEHERDVAVFDLLESNSFRLAQGFAGPYRLLLSLRDANLVMAVEHESNGDAIEVLLSVRPLRSLIKDYFLICDSYYKSIRGAAPSRIEAIDMARRGLHDEGAGLLREALDGKVRDRPRHGAAAVHPGLRPAHPALMLELPGSVLFACSHNAIRSPMAEAILKFFHKRRIYVQSAGVRPGEPDGFAAIVMDEIGIDLSRHRPRGFDDLDDDYFDLVISLSPEAQHRAVELTRDRATELEFWPTPDPSLGHGLARADPPHLSRGARQPDAADRRPVPDRGRAQRLSPAQARRPIRIPRSPERSCPLCRRWQDGSRRAGRR